ncbi:MAG: DNA polymerase I [Clostridia bacterium]|nr:DNA polymerase I [Clostridia bacterium]
MKKLLAIDGNSILNRAYYGVRILTNAEGMPTNALFGLVNIISKQLDAFSPDYTAVAFDLKAPTFRHKMYDSYKAGRKPMPEELAVQLPYAKDVCRAMGLTVLEKEGFEADDILGTLAKMAYDDNNTEAYILTGDKDSLQLITEDGRVNVLLCGNSDTVKMDEAKFKEKYGVSSTVFVDVKALMGDSSDNIPGVPGIGEKTALKLISECGSLDGVYEKLDNSNYTPSLKKKLTDGKESAYLSLDLSRINCSVPLNIGLEELKNNGFNKPELSKLFTKFGFSSFMKRFALDTVSDEAGSVSECEIITAGVDFTEKIAGDTVSVSIVDDRVAVFDGEKIIIADVDISDTTALFTDGKFKVIAYDAKTLYKELSNHGVYFRDAYYDIMLASYVLNPSSGFELSQLALEYLGAGTVPDKYRPQMIFEIYKKLSDRIAGTENAENLLLDIEMPLASVLCDMELKGFRTDTAGLREYGKNLDSLAMQLAERIYFSAGEEFNINSPVKLGEILFEKLGLPAQKKTKTGGYSTGAEILEKLRSYHPIIDDILEYRKVTKLKSTYVEGLIKVADSSGRIHSCFNQTGTATGRLSSSEPNLQNIPIRTELGREMRKFFVPASDDYILIDADYSQIELRVLASISGDTEMTNAFLSGKDIHTSTASTIFSVPSEAVNLEMRKRAKAINFGIVYGMGEFSLAGDLGISIKEAKQYIESYLSSYPKICEYLEGVVREAYDKGYVTTLFGRRRYIPELAGQNKNLKHFGERVAKNSPIQGTAADIIKIAMINTWKALKESGIDASLILQVHDELILEAHKDCADEAARILEECMENAVNLSVPMLAKASIGKTWFDCK